MGHPVNWFQIQGPDGNALQRFYGEVFQWRMSPAPDGTMMMVEPDEGGIAGGIGTAVDGRANIAVYIGVTDVGAHLERVSAVGGQVAMPPLELPGGMGFIAGFVDPAGNWVGLWQPPRMPARRATVKASAPRARPKAAAKKAPAKRAAAKKAAAKKPAPAKRAPAKKPAPAKTRKKR